MDKDNKLTDLTQWRKNKNEKEIKELIETFLEKSGLEATEENIEKAEYHFAFSDELKEQINERNILALMDDNLSVVSYNLDKKKLKLMFYDGNESIDFEVWVDIEGNLQTTLK